MGRAFVARPNPVQKQQESTMHRTFYRGKRVFVQLRNGESFVDHWTADTARGSVKRFAEFATHGKIAFRDIRAINIYREGGA